MHMNMRVCVCFCELGCISLAVPTPINIIADRGKATRKDTL